jgi:hypothetical protein
VLLILTLEDPDAPNSYEHVQAEGADYESALAAARTLVPEGRRVISIRVERN